MKKIILFFFLFGFAIPVFSQQGFEFVKNRSNRITIPFRLINNLVFIPVQVNGVELLFLLDSGVKETILFGFEDTKELNLNHVEKISIQGLGGNEAIEGLKSSGNVLKIDKMQADNYLLYLILDPSFNLSNYVGVTVNGIIGSAAFQNHLVEINYSKKKLSFYWQDSKFQKKIQKKYSSIPLIIEQGKPYVNSIVKIKKEDVPVKLLVDSGNSDAVWLFDQLSDKIEVPEKHFDDYLGQGLSGAVEGKRARIDAFKMADFEFRLPIVAFPNIYSLKNISLQPNRLGSLGGEILKRFTVVFDYKNGQLYLKKNKTYRDPFIYNKSGIEIWHTGVQLVKQLVAIPDNSIVLHAEDVKGDNTTSGNSRYRVKVALKPVYEIGYVRANSTAGRSGLRAGDVLVSIDGKECYDYSLEEINALLWSENEIWVALKILREGKEMDFKFQLMNIL